MLAFKFYMSERNRIIECHVKFSFINMYDPALNCKLKTIVFS